MLQKNPSRPLRRAASRSLLVLAAIGAGHWACQKSVAENAVPTSEADDTPEIPMFLAPTVAKTQALTGVQLPEGELTIVPEIQDQLDTFIQDRDSPITAGVLVEVATGNILAMVQGKSPEKWGGTTHTALHSGFPAASLFKTVVTATAFEVGGIDAEAPIGLVGGCAHVNPSGSWMRRDSSRAKYRMTLDRAYGYSCNGFFAKLAINRLGLGAILNMAHRLGWSDVPIPADFKIPLSPMHAPDPIKSSVHTVGRFAAGFGPVGISPVHAAWQTLVIANNGLNKPLHLFKNRPLSPAAQAAVGQRLITEETAQKIRGVMHATVRNGTASFAFRRGKYRKYKTMVGGKTGTLTGYSPEGLTTWFTGMMPLDHPEVVFATVVILEDLWKFKAQNLAAEALDAYYSWKTKNEALTTAVNTSADE